MSRLRIAAFALALAGCARGADSDPRQRESAALVGPVDNSVDFIERVPEDRPFLAIWRDDDGNVPKPGAPYLRVAIWDDGRVVFANDPKEWGHELLGGHISAQRVALLKDAVAATGVFELKGHCYLGPDMPIDCIMIDDGNRRQMLYWCEGMDHWLDKPHSVAFGKCWNSVNDLALAARPRQLRQITGFQRPPDTW